MNRLTNFFVSALLTGVWGCSDAGVQYRAVPINEDHSAIADPLARWQAYHLTSYVLEQQHSCFCPHGADVCRVYVRDNKVIEVIRTSDGKSIFSEAPQFYKTVDELFALAGALDPDSVASLEVQYDTRFGFPTILSVDRSAQIADEEYMYRSRSLERLVN